MRIGIIGAGPLARAFAVRALASGHTITLSNTRDRDSLAEVIEELGPGARAGTKYEAAGEDIVVLAVPASQVSLALADLGDWEGRTLVDATNNFSMHSPPVPGMLSSSELVADLAHGARVIKALNSLFASVLASDPQPVPGYRRVLFISGDDVPSKGAFESLLTQMGFAPLDLGGLAEGSRLQQVPGGMFTGVDLFVREWDGRMSQHSSIP